eukprot:GGOE01004710.1.p1 GENE.GGOE01004710.1~~GGOE01004710.1.p1  ORF type:complete len:708 (-),score=147.96 GGOE01004710.1:230-2278(-)
MAPSMPHAARHAKKAAAEQGSARKRVATQAQGRPSAQQRRLVVQMMAQRYGQTPGTELKAENLARLQLQADVMRTLRGDSGLTLKSALQDSSPSVPDDTPATADATPAQASVMEEGSNLIPDAVSEGGGQPETTALPTSEGSLRHSACCPPSPSSPQSTPDAPGPESVSASECFGDVRTGGEGSDGPRSPAQGDPGKEKLVLSLLDRIAARKQQIATPVKCRKAAKSASCTLGTPPPPPPTAPSPSTATTPAEMTATPPVGSSAAPPLQAEPAPPEASQRQPVPAGEDRPASPAFSPAATQQLDEFAVPRPRAPTPTSASSSASATIFPDITVVDTPPLRTFSRRPTSIPLPAIPSEEAVCATETTSAVSTPTTHSPDPLASLAEVQQPQGEDNCALMELELGLAGEGDAPEATPSKRCKLLASTATPQWDCGRRVRPDLLRPPVELDALSDGTEGEGGGSLANLDEEDEESEEDNGDAADEADEVEDEEEEARGIADPTGGAELRSQEVLDADEREGLQNSQLMLLRWEMSQSQFEEMDSQSQSQSQYQFEEEDAVHSLSSQQGLDLSQSGSVSRTSSLKRRPSFLGLVGAVDAIHREKLESIKRQNSYSNASFAPIVYAEDSASHGSHGANVPKRRIPPVAQAPEGNLFAALSSAPGVGAKRKRPSDGSGGTHSLKHPKA